MFENDIRICSYKLDYFDNKDQSDLGFEVELIRDTKILENDRCLSLEILNLSKKNVYYFVRCDGYGNFFLAKLPIIVPTDPKKIMNKDRISMSLTKTDKLSKIIYSPEIFSLYIISSNS